jgi:hypothetical protein
MMNEGEMDERVFSELKGSGKVVSVKAQDALYLAMLLSTLLSKPAEWARELTALIEIKMDLERQLGEIPACAAFVAVQEGNPRLKVGTLNACCVNGICQGGGYGGSV